MSKPFDEKAVANALRAYVRGQREFLRGDRSEWARAQRRVLDDIMTAADLIEEGDLQAIADIRT